MMTIRGGVLFGILVLVTMSGCAVNEASCRADSEYNPNFDVSNFTNSTTIDNPFLPLIPDTHFTYIGEGETIQVSVTSGTRVIMGVTAVVVRDTVTENGELIEDTYDWYAQDDDGNVWYMGEDTNEYENGKAVSSKGSWEAGVDGALPGIVMHGTQPPAGEAYYQEYYACEAEDKAEVVSLDQDVSVFFGDYTNCLQTREFTPLEPKANEYKYYCEGVGLVLEVDINSGDRVELTSISS